MSFIVDEKLEEYAERHTTPPDPLLAELAAETKATMSAPQMLTGPIEGRFLELLVAGSRREACARDRHLHRLLGALDGRGDAAGRPHRHARHRAEARRGRPALLRPQPATAARSRCISARRWRRSTTLEGEFDFVFIDADKENYDAYFEAVLPRLSEGGLIAIDNTLWSGRVLDPPDETTKLIAALNDKLATDDRVCVRSCATASRSSAAADAGSVRPRRVRERRCKLG